MDHYQLSANIIKVNFVTESMVDNGYKVNFVTDSFVSNLPTIKIEKTICSAKRAHQTHITIKKLSEFRGILQLNDKRKLWYFMLSNQKMCDKWRN